MSMQLGARAARPASLGKRIGARLITALAVSAPIAAVFFVVRWSPPSGLTDPESGGRIIVLIVGLLVSSGLSIWNLVLLFVASTTLGGKLLGVKYLSADSGEDAKVTVFLKYLLQGVFEGATGGLGAISYLFTMRDGQHWIDRVLRVVAVEKASISAAQDPGRTGPVAARPMVMPVSMPQPSAWAPVPPASPATQPAPVRPADPAMEDDAPDVDASPWARPADAIPVEESPSGAPSAPEQESVSPPAPPPSPFAPPGQPAAPAVAPPAPAVAPVAPPVAPEAEASPALDDRTVVDVEDDDIPVVVLDDGQEIRVDAPVVLGRNPLAPPAYPQARPVQLIDESMRLSKTHLVLLPFAGGIGFVDVGATNGVVVELDGTKTKVTAHEVHELPAGAELHFGSRSLRARS